jgi:hypothetical protein
VDDPAPQPQHTRTLSIHRSFVVRLYAHADPASGGVAGEIEHVVSGAGGEFHGVEALLQLIARVLEEYEVEEYGS